MRCVNSTKPWLTSPNGGDHDFTDERGVHQCWAGRGTRKRDVVGRVLDAPQRAGEIADEARDEYGDQGVIAHMTDDEHFHRKDRPGERCAEDRAETGGDAGHQKYATIFGRDFREPSK